MSPALVNNDTSGLVGAAKREVITGFDLLRERLRGINDQTEVSLELSQCLQCYIPS